MKKRLLAIILCAMVLFIFGCTQTPVQEEEVQINPFPETVNKDKLTIRLYFGYMDERLLVPEKRTLDVSTNESTETSIIKELIKGPSSTRVDFVAVINPDTKVIKVDSMGEYLFVTLSKDFLEPISYAGEEFAGELYGKTQKYLGVYSIVNTLIEQGNYSRVQILVDETNSGNGRPITKAEAGMDGTGALEPFERVGEIELNQANTMREILISMEKKDWNSLYNYIAYKNSLGQDKPTIDEFMSEVLSAKLAVTNVKVVDAIISPDNASGVVMVNYDLKLKTADAISNLNVPIKMINENDVWKITYNTFKLSFLS